MKTGIDDRTNALNIRCWNLNISGELGDIRGCYWGCIGVQTLEKIHDDVIKWKHFPRYWPFVRGIHRFPVNSPHKYQWRGALMFSLICVWINGWVNNREAGDLRRYRAHYDVLVMTNISLRFLKAIWIVKRTNLVHWTVSWQHYYITMTS